MTDPKNFPPSTFMSLREFLYDIQRSEQYFRDHYDDDAPRLPRLFRQGSSKMIERQEGNRYKHDVKRFAGLPVRGRPRKTSTTIDTAA